MRLDMVPNFLADLLSSSQQHHRVLLEEERVVDIGVTCSHGSLVHHYCLRLPDLQDWHACDWALWVLQS